MLCSRSASLTQQYADVAAHGEDKLAEILRLLGAVRLQLQPRQLGHTIDQAGDFLAEPGFDLRQLDRRVLDDVVQQAGDDRGDIEPIAGQNLGYGDRMRNVGIAVVAPLVPCAWVARWYAVSIRLVSALGS